jgi:hypothetical protein
LRSLTSDGAVRMTLNWQVTEVSALTRHVPDRP